MVIVREAGSEPVTINRTTEGPSITVEQGRASSSCVLEGRDREVGKDE